MRTFHEFGGCSALKVLAAFSLAVVLTGATLWLLEGRWIIGGVSPIVAAPGSRNTVATDVTGDITQDTIWTSAGSPYIIDAKDITVQAGVALTIEPGVVIQGGPGDELKIQGRLYAVGTETDPITFTSVADSDQNEWAGLGFDGGTGDLQYVVVRYAGWPNSVCNNKRSGICVKDVTAGDVKIKDTRIMTCGYDSLVAHEDHGLYIIGSRVEVRDTLFQGNGTFGTSRDFALSVRDPGSILTVADNVFRDNGGYAIGIAPIYMSSFWNNTFEGTAEYSRRILIAGGDVPQAGLLRAQTSLEGYELERALRVPANMTLTVAPSVTVMGQAQSGAELKVLGHLKAVGTEDQPIFFTSADNSGPGQWPGLVFDGGTGDLAYAAVRYAGEVNSLGLAGNLVVSDVVAGELRVENSQILTQSYSREDYGIYVKNSRIVVSGTRFVGNGNGAGRLNDYALYVTGNNSAITVAYNVFENNLGYAVGIEPRLINEVVSNTFVGTNGAGRRIVIANGQVPDGRVLVAQEGLQGYQFEKDLTVPAAVTLEVASGVTVMGSKNAQLWVDGHLQAMGTEQHPITFTSAEIGSRWAGLIFSGGTGDLRYTHIGYGGGATEFEASGDFRSFPLRSNLVVTNVVAGEVRVENGIIHNVYDLTERDRVYGLYVSNSHLTLKDTWIRDNGNQADSDLAMYVTRAGSLVTMTGGGIVQNQGLGVMVDAGRVNFVCADVLTNTGDGIVVQDNGELFALGSGIFGNAYGFRNTRVETMTAEYNWWGDASGPNHDSNPGGTGSQVSYYVDFRPWSDKYGCLADLAIAKVGPGPTTPVTAGLPLTYTILVTHEGGFLPATNIVISDTPRYEMSYVTATFSSGIAGGCREDGGVPATIFCTLDRILVGETAVVSLVVRPNADGVLDNAVMVWSEQVDLTDTNDTGAWSVTVNPAVDLAAVIEDVPDPVVVKNPLVYEAAVRNPGPSMAHNVMLTMTWPASATMASFSPAPFGGSCISVSLTQITCTWASLDHHRAVTATVVVTPEEDGVLASWAEVRAATPVEVNRSDNTLSITTTVEPAADISLTLHAPTEVYVLDSTTTYTISVENGGPDDATGVMITNTLPMSTTYQEGSPGCIAGAHEVTCTIGALRIGSRRTVTLRMQADEAHIVITHTAEVGAREADPVLENNARTITRTVLPQADIAVHAWDAPDPVVVNRPLTYTIVVSNAGPSQATGVTLTSVLPVSVTVGWITTTQGLCVETQDFASLQVSCTLDALAKDEMLTVTMGITPLHDGVIINAVRTMAAEHDPYGVNGNVDVETVVDPAADLRVSLVDWPDPVYVAYPLTYTIWVTNAGPDVAHDVRLTDTLPVSLTYDVSAWTDQGRCEGNSGIFGDLIKCRLGIMPISGTATVTVTVEPRESGVFTNQVAVSAYEDDPNPLNDIANEATTVQDWDADIRVAVQPSRDAVHVGDRLTYTVVVSNAGPLPATGVQLTHTLSPVLPYTFTASDWRCITGTMALTCTLPTSLSVRGSASLRVVVTPAITGSIESRARVRADEVDNNEENNFVVKLVQVSDVIVDLGVALTAQDSVVGGDPLLYTMVVSNAGPDSATGVWVTQTLPVSVTYMAASERCQRSGQVVACTVGALDVGPTLQLTVAVGTPDVSSAVTVTSEAEVSGNEPDAVLGNNTDFWSTLIATADFSRVYLPLVLRD